NDRGDGRVAGRAAFGGGGEIVLRSGRERERVRAGDRRVRADDGVRVVLADVERNGRTDPYAAAAGGALLRGGGPGGVLDEILRRDADVVARSGDRHGGVVADRRGRLGEADVDREGARHADIRAAGARGRLGLEGVLAVGGVAGIVVHLRLDDHAARADGLASRDGSLVVDVRHVERDRRADARPATGRGAVRLDDRVGIR